LDYNRDHGTLASRAVQDLFSQTYDSAEYLARTYGLQIAGGEAEGGAEPPPDEPAG
jgi:hypothetical protein